MIIRGPNPLSSLSFIRFGNKAIPQFPHTILSSRFCTSSANSISTAPTSSQTLTSSVNHNHHHPWPEWMAFVTRLNSLGYFPKSSSDAAVVSEFNYGEIDVFKDPCLSFARDRYDLFRLLFFLSFYTKWE